MARPAGPGPLATRPGSPEAPHDKALALARLGRTKAALSVYEDLGRVDTTDADAWARKGHLLEEAGKTEEAGEAYRAAPALNPKDERAWCGLGNALYSAEQYEEAIPRPHHARS